MVGIAIRWGLLVLLCQQTLVTAHVLGRSYSTSDLAQLKSLLERFEETLATLVQVEDPVPDYEGNNPDPDRGQTSPVWDRDREGQRPPPSSDVQEPQEDYSMAQSPRYRLQDVLMAARSKTSGCFGARLDRIGNSSGLGCNNRKG